MELNAEELDRLLGDSKTPGDVDRLYSQLLQRIINRSLEAEMEAHLAEEKASGGGANRRNGKLAKVVKGTFGEFGIETPRDRQGALSRSKVGRIRVGRISAA